MHNHIHKSERGFTLLEAVVAATIFAFVISSILGVYLYVLRLNTRTRALRELAQDSRFVTDFLSKEIRNGHLDYTQGDYRATNAEIHVVNQNNEQEDIYLFDDTTNARVADSSSCGTDVCSLVLAKNSATSKLNSVNTKVTNLAFVVAPSKDPYSISNIGLANNNVQPHVTIILELTANTGARDAVKMDLQSTFSELYYPPRQ